ncbi:branched-chain amino acid ABC transporter substrate-binding protein [Roseateles sp. BYS180W]|uniref:Branched-chain amino acid ABC transporter substrate-binding protein n=1 Tax=Roseateles rivi TaxID=3299028 RepID=A0ABW7FRU7_9BURK
MTERPWRSALLAALLWALSGPLLAAKPAAPAPAKAGARVLELAVVGVADDPRYLPRRLEKRWPGQSLGRLLGAAQLSAEDAQLELEQAQLQLRVQDAQAPSSAELGALLQQLGSRKVGVWLLDLPDALMPQALQAAQAAQALAINASSSADALRAQACRSAVLHTLPSQAMLADALAQFLAAHQWRQALLLHGGHADDAALLQAWQRAAKRYGISHTDTRRFKFSTDPREREAANPRLLSAERRHDAVLVWDSEGEFARALPYNTQQPRPVLGSNGLVALAWHPLWERYGGPQLNRRFSKRAQRPMSGQDWAAWVGVKAVVSAWVAAPEATPVQLSQRLRAGGVPIDGFKGLPLSVRPWDGQLRQPVLLGHADGVAATAPVEGVLHPTDTLDTLGLEEKESACKR